MGPLPLPFTYFKNTAHDKDYLHMNRRSWLFEDYTQIQFRYPCKATRIRNNDYCLLINVYVLYNWHQIWNTKLVSDTFNNTILSWEIIRKINAFAHSMRTFSVRPTLLSVFSCDLYGNYDVSATLHLLFSCVRISQSAVVFRLSVPNFCGVRH